MEAIFYPYSIFFSLLVALVGWLALSKISSFRFCICSLQRRVPRIWVCGLDNSGKSTLVHLLQTDRISLIGPNTYSSSHEVFIKVEETSDVAKKRKLCPRFTNVVERKVELVDISHYPSARRTRLNVHKRVDGVLFLLDSADPSRFEESLMELRDLEDHFCRNKGSIPIAILANKVDQKKSYNLEATASALHLILDTSFWSTEIATVIENATPLYADLAILVKQYATEPRREARVIKHSDSRFSLTLPCRIFATSLVHRFGISAAFKWLLSQID
jgi:GTPase SAR1 family protein